MKDFSEFISEAAKPTEGMALNRAAELRKAKKAVADASHTIDSMTERLDRMRSMDMGGDPSSSAQALEDRLDDIRSEYRALVAMLKGNPRWDEVMASVNRLGKLTRSSLGEATTPLSDTDPRDKYFEKLKKLKGVTYQGRGFYIIPAKLLEGSVGILRYRQVKQRTNRYELTTMGDLMGWQHPQANDFRLKDWEEA